MRDGGLMELAEVLDGTIHTHIISWLFVLTLDRSRPKQNNMRKEVRRSDKVRRSDLSFLYV